MANQRTPSTDTVEDITVEKIILSGSPFVSAVLGHGSYRIAADAAPVFYTEPVVTGSVYPPSELFCDTGAFNSSPRASITYQWKRDGVDMGGETSNTLTTVLGDIGDAFTCLVTITNPSGADTGLSNGLLMLIRLPQNVYELDIMPIQGLSMPIRFDATSLTVSIIQGVANNMKVDVDELDIAFIQGMVNNIKIDNNEMDVYVMGGTSTPATIATEEVDAYAMQGVSSSLHVVSEEIDAYAMFLPILLTPLVVVNGDAELVSMAAWTMDTNTVTSETSAPGSATANREGARFFVPEQLGQGVDSQMSQVIVIPGGDLTDVDTGLCYCVVRFLHMSDEGFDKMVITLKALDAADATLATKIYSPDAGPTNRWLIDSNVDDPLSLPTLTRKIKIIVLFDAHATSGTAVNSVYADDFQIEFMKTA